MKKYVVKDMNDKYYPYLSLPFRPWDFATFTWAFERIKIFDSLADAEQMCRRITTTPPNGHRKLRPIDYDIVLRKNKLNKLKNLK